MVYVSRKRVHGALFWCTDCTVHPSVGVCVGVGVCTCSKYWCVRVYGLSSIAINVPLEIYVTRYTIRIHII